MSDCTKKIGLTLTKSCNTLTISWKSGIAVKTITRDNTTNVPLSSSTKAVDSPPAGSHNYDIALQTGDDCSFSGQAGGCQTTHSTYLLLTSPDGGEAPIPGEALVPLAISIGGGDPVRNPFDSFVLLVPQGDKISEFLHQPDNIVGSSTHWKLVQQLDLLPNQVIQDTSLSIVQSSDGKLVAIVRAAPSGAGSGDSGMLLGYEFRPDTGWRGPVPLRAKGRSDDDDNCSDSGAPSAHDGMPNAHASSGSNSPAHARGDNGQLNNVTASQAFIESFKDGQNRFELLTPSGNEMFHYAYDVDEGIDEPGTLVAKFPPLAEGSQFAAVSLLQSFTDDLVAIALVTPTNTLAGYVFRQTDDDDDGDSSDEHDRNTWQPFEIRSDQGSIDGVTGSPVFIQSDDTTFDLIVPQGAVLNHYQLIDQAFQQGVWHLRATLPPLANEQVQVISLALTLNASGNLELAARARPSQGGDFMVGYVFDRQTGTWGTPLPLRDDNGVGITASDGSTPPADPGQPAPPPTSIS